MNVVFRLKATPSLKLRYLPGIVGPSGSVELGTVTTGAAGTNVIITNTGTPQAAVLNFTIPRGDTGVTGDKGWSPILAIVTDGARRVVQISDWTGGQGTKPAVGDYIGPTGLTSVIANAVDIRGAAGATGPSVPDGDKGDITVSSSGTVWTIDNDAVTAAKIADAELKALAGLVGAADKVPYFTGPGAAALADFGTLARALLAGTSVAAMRATLALGSGQLAGHRNKLLNGDGALNQRTATAPTDDTYAWDRHNVLTQTAAVGSSTLVAPAAGISSMMRMTQSQATAQRMGFEQIILSDDTYDLRGKLVTLGGKLRYSNAAPLRFAILEWTGTADAPVSDIVNSWTNGTFTAGQFFNSTTLNVLQVGTITPTAATITDWSVEATVGASATNVISFLWTEGTAAQSSTLDLRWYLVEGKTTGESDPFSKRAKQQELALCQYYFRTTGAGARVVASGFAYSSTIAIGFLPYATMRVAPTPTFKGTTANYAVEFAGSASSATSLTTNFGGAQVNGCCIQFSTPAVLSAQGSLLFDLTNDAEITFDAEL